MKTIKELLKSANYTNLDPNEAYNHSLDQVTLIESLIDQFPNVEIEDNWSDYFYEYLDKLFQTVCFKKDGYGATSDIEVYDSSYIHMKDALSSLFQKYVIHTPNKLNLINKIRQQNIGFIEQNSPSSVAIGWLIEFFCNGENITRNWNLNEKEYERVLKIIKDLLNQSQIVLIKKDSLYKDRDVILSSPFDIRDSIDSYYNNPNDKKEMFYQLDLIELTGIHYLGLNIEDSFFDVYSTDNSTFNVGLLKSSFTNDLLLSNSLYQSENKKTTYLLLLTRYFLMSMDTVLENIQTLKKILEQGGSIGNTFGISNLKDAIDCLLFCTKEVDQLTDYLSDYIKDANLKFILKIIINHNYYSFIEGYDAPTENNFVKDLVMKSCDLNSDNQADIDLKRFLVQWGMIDESYIPLKERIIIPEALPQSVSDLKELVDQLKIEPHLKFHDGADQSELMKLDLPEDIKQIYAWKNGCVDDRFMGLIEQSVITDSVINQFNDHVTYEEIDELEEEDFSWPNDVDIRNHIDDNIIGIGRISHCDSYFINQKSISTKGKPIVFCNFDDKLLIVEAVANSVEEHIGRLMIDYCIKIYGPHTQLKALLDTEVIIDNNFS